MMQDTTVAVFTGSIAAGNVCQLRHLVALVNANYKDLNIQNALYLYAV